MAQVCLEYQRFRSLQTKILAISFGTEYWAKMWLEQTEAPFPLLLDQDRTSYRRYGLERSLLRSWGLKNTLNHIRLRLSGRKFHGIQGDSGQLGGNFIVDNQGIIRFAYPSYDPTDRPSIPHLLQVVNNLS